MIFYVEDDPEIRNLVLYTLKASGFEAKGFLNGDDLFKEIKKTKPELILLDIMLPGDDGLTILKKLKSGNLTSDIPVIMSTAKGSEYDKVMGLETGADDYLVKPFGMMEMVARIKALLRRIKALDNSILKNGGIEIDEGRHVALVNGNMVQLTLKEYDILCLLLRKVNHVLTRDYLLEVIWGSDFFGETRTVDVHVGTLRTKLGKEGRLIETVRGVGYKMVDKYEEENI